MAFFALLWKARTIENYRINYEKEKINSMLVGQTQLEQTLSQRWRHYRVDTKKRISRVFQKWYPDGSAVSNFFLYLVTDQTFPNFLLKSVMGFVGGIILTYLCFMFFVFQLAISLIHATIMSSIIGVLLTLGLAFSYRIRCLVFLLIPQFFSRVGRYTLTCYALVLILTGPATNTLKNSEVLSESMACSQEQIKTSVHQLNDLIKNPVNAIKDSIKLMVDQLQVITTKVKETAIRIDRLVLSVATAIQSSYSWLQSVIDMCNAKLGTPYDRCCNVIQNGMARCQKTLNPEVAIICNVASMANMACYSLKPFKAFCYATDIMDEAILASVKKKLRNLSEHLRAMFYVDVHVHHAYIYSSNTSRSASQVAAGIVTEIRNRADPLLTWLSWSSCVTSLFLLLIIFRAKYYQHMYETRSRFDNCYVTKELQELDLKRQQQGRETVLPLNRRERAKYITTSSFRLVASEKVYLNRSAVFMAITTFKLLIHMVADYSLYWVLMTIRYHGRFQSELMPGIPHSGAHVHGTGFVARLFNSLVEILEIPLSFPAPSSIACLPDPYSPDLRRYTQIGVLIFLLWFFALFEPYGLRLRHLIMGHYRPERAKARATWLFNHILRTRVSFMKFARRKLHREYKYSSEASLTFRQWITDLIPFQCVRSLVGLGPKPDHCLLCGITSCSSDPDSQLTKCPTPRCPGVFCISCFVDIGELCTICLSPAEYGDLSDVSLEKGSSDDSDSDVGLNEGRMDEHAALLSNIESGHIVSTSRCEDRRWDIFSRTICPDGPLDAIAFLRTRTLFTTLFKKRLKTIQGSMKKHYRSKKYTLDWIAKLTPENMFKDFSKDDNQNFYSNFIDDYDEHEEVIIRTKSIGVNTDRNRGVLLNMLVNSFTRRNSKQPDLKRYKKLPAFFTEVKFKELRNFKLIHLIEKQTVIESSKRTLFATKTILAHNLTICQRNLKTVVKSKRDDGTKDKIKGYNELKGVMKAIRYFLNNKQINISNQNNGNTSNHSRIANKREINKNKKKNCSKTNKQKRHKRQKEGIKILRKNSRHRMNEFQSFFSNHWNNFKCSLMPCTAQNRSEIPIPKIKRNHKRRKKRKLGVDDIDDCFVKKDMKQTRNVRISAFLAELEWTKKEYKKKKDFGEAKDSFPPKAIAPAPNTTTKIVNMVQLKNLPFQWREAPKYGYCRCGDEKCNCGKKPSSISKLVSSISRHKLYPREALQRFRNRITTAITPSSSLVNRMLSTIKTAGVDRPYSRDSSICIAKRPSIYRPFNEEFGQNIDSASIKSEQSDILDTDILFKNLRYDDYKQDTSNSNHEINMMIPSLHLQDSDIIVSRSNSSKEGKPRITKGCKCDMFEDIQRKWEHVKKSKMIKMKKFCSTLFGPSCTKKTCPHRVIPRELKIKNSPRKIKKPPKEKKRSSKSKVAGGCQTHNLKEIHTQVSNSMVREKYCAKEKAKLDKCIKKRSPQTVQDNKDNKGNNTENCMPPQQQTYGIQTDNWKVVGTQSSRAAGVQENNLVSKSCSALCEEPECVKAQQDAITSAAPEDIQNKSLKANNLINTFTQFSLQDIKKDTETKSCEVQQQECLSKQAGTTSLKTEVAQPETFKLEVSKPSTITWAATLKKKQNGGGLLRMPLTMQASVDNCSNPFKNSGCQPDCYNYNRCSQYEEQEPAETRAPDCISDPYVKCMCEDSFRSMHQHATCTCATQHMNCGIKLTTVRPAHTIDPFTTDETSIPLSPGINKKTQFRHKQKVVNREVSCIKNYRRGKDVKTSVSLLQSNESHVLLNLDYGMNVAGALHGESSDTITERSNSTISLISDGSKTDTTICSHATCNYDDANRRRKLRVKVVTKTNQATLTDKTRVCDTGTITSDWWSPIVERKGHETILLEKKKGFNTIERHKKEWRELKEIRKGRIVSFKSRTQIIPTALLSAKDVLSPSRYLLESQRYYNELFAGNYRPRPQAAYVTQMPKYHEKEKTRSPVGSRRNHLHRKTKRLDECYSPIRQVSPRKRKTDQSTKTSDSPRRKPHRHDRPSNNRHYAKVGSPKKRA